MTQEERQKLIDEDKELAAKISKSDFVNPKDMRRRDEISSLLMTNGESSELQFKVGKPRKSRRVTSFTRDRR